MPTSRSQNASPSWGSSAATGRRAVGSAPAQPLNAVEKADTGSAAAEFDENDYFEERVEHRNQVGRYAAKVMRSEFNRVNAHLAMDIQAAIEGHAIYLPNLLCGKYDYSILRALAADLETGLETGLVTWSRHLKHEDPDFSPTFKAVIQQLSAYFDVEVLATRLNFYRNGSDWKPFHHDSHAYGAKGKKEDFTIGASFGATRELAFQHPSGTVFSFPQWNGDVFAFTSTANKTFQHGVPKATNAGPRFSIIAWGKRRTLNKRNSTEEEQRERQAHEDYTVEDDEDGGAGAKHVNALAFARAKMRSIDAQTKHADVHSDTPATADAEKPRTSDAEQLGHDGCSGVPQVTEVSTQVASFCKSMERYTAIEMKREQAAKEARRRQHAQITGTVDVGDDDAKDKKKKKKEKKDKKKSKKGKKEPKVKSRVQGSWGR